jgi:hypothetical protein
VRQRTVIVALVLATAFSVYYFGREALIAATALCVGIFVDEALGRRIDLAALRDQIEVLIEDAVDGLRASGGRQRS